MRLTATIIFGLLLVACGGGGGGGDDGDDGDDTQEPPTAYRADFIELRDPHMFAFDGSIDVTDVVNDSIAEAVTMDTDDPADGELDLSIVFVFRPVDVTGSGSRVDAVLAASCTAPAAGTTCTADADSTVVESNATNSASGCLAPGAGTTGGYDPAVGTPAGPCFVTDPETVTLVASGVELMLADTEVAADYGATGAPDRLENGLMIGFMSEAVAMTTTIPEDTPVVGGEMLDTLLLDSDMDTGPDGSTMGWYFHFNFTAGVVPYE